MRSHVTVQVLRLGDAKKDQGVRLATARERLDLMWQLALDAWAFKGEPVAEPRLPRHVVRAVRRGG